MKAVKIKLPKRSFKRYPDYASMRNQGFFDGRYQMQRLPDKRQRVKYPHKLIEIPPLNS